MKSVAILLFSLFIFSASVSAQRNDERKASFGITFTPFGDLSFVKSYDVIGSPSYNLSSFYTLGVALILPVNEWLDFEGGVEYKWFKVIINPAPGVNLPSHTDKVSMIDIPLLFRANFLKYAFVNGGLVISSNTGFSAISSSGISGRIGAGLKYEFQRFGVFVNPYVSLNPIISFSSNSPDRMLEGGIRLGVTFKL